MALLCGKDPFRLNCRQAGFSVERYIFFEKKTLNISTAFVKHKIRDFFLAKF